MKYFPPEGKAMDIVCGMCNGWMRFDEYGDWYCQFSHHPVQAYRPHPSDDKAEALDRSVEGYYKKLGVELFP